MGTIQFNFLKSFGLQERKDLKKFIFSIVKNERKSLQHLNFVFCSDEYILDINERFLQHDYFTDIITFDLSEPGARDITAEIYISVDTVRSNAVLFKSSFKMEIHRVIFHGVLHLCGYGDKTAKQQTEMRSLEDKYLKKYFSK